MLLSFVVGMGALPVASFSPKPHATVATMSARANTTLRASRDFRMLGVSWPKGEASPASVSVRTSRDGKHFTHWTSLEIAPDEAPDPGSHEAQNLGTDPLWVGHARYAQVRWTGHLSPDAKVATIDPGPDPQTPAASAMASPSQPTIITRAQWGADESIRKGHPEYAEPLKMVFIHHTVSGNGYAKSDSAAIVRSIYAYHVKTNGWNDIGYNFLVDRYGQIFEGRYGGMTRALIGAHSLGFNMHSAGIAVIGTFDGVAPPSAAIASVERLAAWRMDRAYIRPNGTSVMTSGGNPRYPEGTNVTLNNISGHRDVYDTDCPGGSLYGLLPGIRSTVQNIGDPKLFDPVLSTNIITPNGDGRAEGANLKGNFSSAVSWKVAVQTASGTTIASWKGSGTSFSTTWFAKNSSGSVVSHGRYKFVVTASNGHGSMKAASFTVYVWGYPNGTYFRTSSGWLGFLQGGKLRHIVDERASQSWYGTNEALPVAEQARNVYNAGADVGWRDGSLVRMDTSMWLISSQQRRPISSATISALHYNTSAIVDTNSTALAPTPQGTTVSATGAYPNGTGLKSSDGHEAVVTGGDPRPFTTTRVRKSYGYRDVDLAGPADMDVLNAQANMPMGFRDGALIQASGDSKVYVIVDGYRRWLPSSVFKVMGYSTKNIRAITPAELTLNPQGAAI